MKLLMLVRAARSALFTEAPVKDVAVGHEESPDRHECGMSELALSEPMGAYETEHRYRKVDQQTAIPMHPGTPTEA